MTLASKKNAWTFLLIAFLIECSSAMGQQAAPPDYSKSPEWFPRFYKPYVRQNVPPAKLVNTSRLTQMIQQGKIPLSLQQLLSAVVENNLDIAAARYSNSVAETDVLRAKSGQAPRGIEGAPIPSGLFAGAIGAGVGGAGGGGAGGIGGGGGISGQARAVTITPRGAFDPAFVLNFSLDHTASPLNTVRVSGVPVVTTATTFLQGSYQQGFTSGTTLSFTLSNQRQNSTQRSLLFNPSVVTRYSLAITQNLLNGFGFAVNRRFQDVAENNRRIAQELFRQRVISVLAQAQNLYWDLAASHENIRNAEHALAVARQLYEDNKKREEAGTVSGMDVVAAESEMAARKRDLIIAQSEFQTKELALKNIFSKEIDSQLAAAPIETTDPLPDPKVADMPRLNEAVAAAMRSRPELRRAEENILKQKVVDRFTRDSLRPRLTAFALLASAGLAGDHVIPDPSGGPPIVIPGGLAQAFRQVARLDFPEYAAGVTLTLPLKNRNAQADDLRARLEEQEAEASLQRVRLQIGLEVRKAIISLMQSRARVEAARNAVRLSQEVLNAEEQKLQVGLSTSYDVIRRQRDLVSAQREEVQAHVNYVEAWVEMGRATGTSLEASNISWDGVLRGRN